MSKAKSDRWAAFERIERAVDRVLTVIAAAILVGMVALVAIAVAARYVFNAPLTYSYDLSTLLFAWTIFLGLYIAERENSHISLDIVVEHLTPGMRRVVAIIRQILLIAITCYLTWIGIQLILRTGMQVSSLRISAKWLYASMPVGFGLLAFIYLLRLPRIITTREA